LTHSVCDSEVDVVVVLRPLHSSVFACQQNRPKHFQRSVTAAYSMKRITGIINNNRPTDNVLWSCHHTKGWRQLRLWAVSVRTRHRRHFSPKFWYSFYYLTEGRQQNGGCTVRPVANVA